MEKETELLLGTDRKFVLLRFLAFMPEIKRGTNNNSADGTRDPEPTIVRQTDPGTNHNPNPGDHAGNIAADRNPAHVRPAMIINELLRLQHLKAWMRLLRFWMRFSSSADMAISSPQDRKALLCDAV